MIENIRKNESLANILSTDEHDEHNSGPFFDFNEWLSEVVQQVRPDYIVGIARGAVRILQLQNIRHIIPKTAILSDYALPFLDDDDIRGKRVLLFDDSVIFGSTLAQVRDYLLSRGALVFCAAYIVDRCNFLGEEDPETQRSVAPSRHKQIPIHCKKLLWPGEIRRHHNKLIDSILATRRDYNLDFPKIRLTTSGFRASDLPYLVELLRKTEVFRNMFDVSSGVSTANGVFRYTALLKSQFSGVLSEGGLSFRPYSKARMIFIPDNGEIHLTPIPQLVLTDRKILGSIKFDNPVLQSLWQEMNLPQRREDEFYAKAVFRLMTFFKGAILGEYLRRELTVALASELSIQDYSLVSEDFKPALGPVNSAALKRIWLHLNKVESIPGLTSNELEIILDSREFTNEPLLAEICGKWDSRQWLKPHGGELAYEILGKVFLTLREVTDSAKAREQNPDASRLEVGLTFEGIRFLLKQYCGINLAPSEISLALDICADNGQAVPKVIRQNGVWLRAFYSGENQHAHTTLQLKEAFHKAYSDFLDVKKIRALNQFDVHKLCVTLKDILRWLPISTRFNTYGRFATVNIGYSELPVIDWLVNHGTGPLTIDKDDEGRTVLLVNDGYESSVDPSWQPDDSRKFFDAFQYVATAFATVKGDAPKLLLSTCRTHTHTYNAVAVEAYNWVEHDRADFRRLIIAARLTEGGSLRDVSNTLEGIYWCTRYLSEAREKHDIFDRRFESTKRQLEKAFRKQGKSATRFWQYAILEKNLLDRSTDPEIELLFTILMPLLTQMRHLTAYLSGMLIGLRLISENELAEKFRQEKSSLSFKNFQWLTEYDPQRRALLYNENIAKSKVTGWSIERTRLPVEILRVEDFTEVAYNDLLKTVQICFDEISSSLTSFCRHYKTKEEDFPFSPKGDVRVFSEGGTERILRNVFILTLDIIGSSGNFQSNEMKDFILRTFQESPHRGDIYFDISGNDAFLVCCTDPVVLIDIARIITIRGETLKQAGGNFGGTRKGLSFGTVRYVETTEGHPRVMDLYSGETVSQAFSILEGINDYYATSLEKRNATVIVEQSTAKLLSFLPNFKTEEKDLFNMRSKHFIGQCYCFSL